MTDIYNFSDETKHFIEEDVLITKLFNGKVFKTVNSNYCREETWKKHQAIYDEIMSKIPDQNLHLLQSKTQISAKLKLISRGLLQIPKCPECQALVSFRNNEFHTFCGTSCANASSLTKEKRISTNITKYGGNAPACSASIITKMQDTCTERYGALTYMDTPEFKRKSKDTKIVRYGVEHVTQNEYIMSQIQQTNMERYGVVCTLQATDAIEKTKRTKLKKYGVDHEMKNGDYVKKHMKSIYRHKSLKLPSGKIVEVQGYEDRAILLMLETHNESELTIAGIQGIPYKYDGIERVYHPDFMIGSTVYEVKCSYTWNNSFEMNVAKLQALQAAKIDFVLMIYPNSYIREDLPPMIFNNTIPGKMPTKYRD